MIITVTERGGFKRCIKQWDYSSFNMQHITSLTPPTALSFGTLIHKCHEEWLLHPEQEVEEIVMQVAGRTLLDLKASYKKVVGVEPADEELISFRDQMVLALEMMGNYKAMWGASLPEGFTLVKPEQTIVVPIPGTEHKCPSCEGLGTEYVESGARACPECRGAGEVFHYLELTLDALMKDEGGRLWILERKTYDRKTPDEVMDTNDQFLGYLWGLSQITDEPIGGVFYDGMWKRDLSGKRTLEELFRRKALTRAQEELDTFEVELRREALMMARAAADPEEIVRNRRWEGCYDCQFNKLCLAEMRGEDADYIRGRFYVQREGREWSVQE